jgi:hypothetical protein
MGWVMANFTAQTPRPGKALQPPIWMLYKNRDAFSVRHRSQCGQHGMPTWHRRTDSKIQSLRLEIRLSIVPEWVP